MKIEIAENLVYSYLKHIEGCRIVQTNWKTSGKWSITEYDEKQATSLYTKIKTHKEFEKIFRKNSFSQLIKQAEIDVLGLNTTENAVYGIDVAYHSGGLNYGGVDDSTAKVLMKIFRTIFIMQTYFSGFDKFHSYFVAPKANPSVYNPILERIQIANEIINDELISVKFIANEDFYESMIDPLKIGIKDESDTGELFSRALKLLQLDPRHEKKGNINYILKNENKKNFQEKITENGMKIGQYVQFNIKKLYEQGFIDEDEILRLQQKEYSKNVFDQNYEILRSNEKEITSNDGRNRYYSREKFCGDYYLTSQWVEKHWNPFKDWEKKIRTIVPVI